MPFFLHERDTTSSELMDREDCSQAMLRNTYRHFYRINRLLSGWSTLFYRYILPRCSQPGETYTMLDIGFGGGDIPLRMHELAVQNGIKLHITAIDIDPRALEYVQEHIDTEAITFRCASEEDLIQEGGTYDFIISNHLVHHLQADELLLLLQNCQRLNKGLLLFNDLRRSPMAWILFNMLTSFTFRKSFIRADGLISIKRSYTPKELRKLLPDEYRVESLRPFRLVILQETT